MNILITGGNGLLGLSLIDILADKHNIFALIDNNSSLRFPLKKNIKVIYNDLTNLKLNDLPNNIDIIYYLAQSRRFRDFPDGIVDILKINIEAPLRIVRWALDKKIKKFIYASSGGVYRNLEKPLKEIYDINANKKKDFYSDSKLSSEILLRNFSNMFETFVITRPFFIYGEKQKKHMLIPRLINSVINSKEIILNSDEGIKINPINVFDAALAYSNMINLKGELLINISGNEIVSIKKLCNMIGNKVNKKPIFKKINNNQGDIIADNSLMIKKLHKPKISLNEGIDDLINH